MNSRRHDHQIPLISSKQVACRLNTYLSPRPATKDQLSQIFSERLGENSKAFSIGYFT